MLSSHYQIFLMLLQKRPLLKSEVRLFTTAKSFYKMTSYMLRNDLIVAEHLSGNRKRYLLSMKGDIIATILSGLSDHDQKMIDRCIVGEYSNLGV